MDSQAGNGGLEADGCEVECCWLLGLVGARCVRFCSGSALRRLPGPPGRRAGDRRQLCLHRRGPQGPLIRGHRVSARIRRHGSVARFPGTGAVAWAIWGHCFGAVPPNSRGAGVPNPSISGCELGGCADRPQWPLSVAAMRREAPYKCWDVPDLAAEVLAGVLATLPSLGQIAGCAAEEGTPCTRG